MATNKLNSDTELTPLQERAIYLLVSGKSITDVSRELKTDRVTLYNWQSLSEFEAFYNRTRLEFKEQARNELVSLFGDAISTLKNCLKSGNENVKLKAAMYVLECISDFQPGPSSKERINKQKMLEW